MASAQDLSEYENDPRLFLFTSLTAGSSHIITATSRLETILKANKIPFQAIDTATDERARRLWQRRSRGKKLPGLVKEGFVVGDLEEIEEWNEFGELKENIGPVPANNAAPPTGGPQGVNIRPPEATSSRSVSGASIGAGASGSKAPKPLLDSSKMVALPGAAEIAAKNKAQQEKHIVIDEPPKPETMTSAPAEKEMSINAAKKILKDDHPGLEHLSAPPSALQSGTATPLQQESAASEVKLPTETGTDALEGMKSPTEAEYQTEILALAAGVPGDVGSVPPPESSTAAKEEQADDEETEASKGVESLTVTEANKPQEQDSKAAEDATKSVED